MAVSNTRDTAISNIIKYNPSGPKVLFEKETFHAYPEHIGKQHNVYKTLPQLVTGIVSFIQKNHSFVCQKDSSIVEAFKLGLGKITRKIFQVNQTLGTQLFRSVKTIKPTHAETRAKVSLAPKIKPPILLTKSHLLNSGFAPFYSDALVAYFKNKPFTFDQLEKALLSDITKRNLALDALELEFSKKQIVNLLQVKDEWIDEQGAQELESVFGKMKISHDQYVKFTKMIQPENALARQQVENSDYDSESDFEDMDNGDYYLSMIAPKFDNFIAKSLLDLQIGGHTLLDQINRNDEFDIEDHEEMILDAGNAMTKFATINELILNALVKEHSEEKVYANAPALHPFKLIDLTAINMT